jgi:hypothetical protein
LGPLANAAAVDQQHRIIDQYFLNGTDNVNGVQALTCLLRGAVLQGAPVVFAPFETCGQPSRVLFGADLIKVRSKGTPIAANPEDPGIGSHERRLQIPNTIIDFSTRQQDAIGIGQNRGSACSRPDDTHKDAAALIDGASVPNRGDYGNVEVRAELQHFGRTCVVKNPAA